MSFSLRIADAAVTEGTDAVLIASALDLSSGSLSVAAESIRLHSPVDLPVGSPMVSTAGSQTCMGILILTEDTTLQAVGDGLPGGEIHQ